jgi:hypothetical protein
MSPEHSLPLSFTVSARRPWGNVVLAVRNGNVVLAVRNAELTFAPIDRPSSVKTSKPSLCLARSGGFSTSCCPDELLSTHK